MAFRFSLQTLLQFRKSVEHQQELLLQEANHQVTRVRHEIEGVDGFMAEMAARRARELDSGVSAAELQFENLCRLVLLEHRRQLQRALAEREEVRVNRSQAFHEARRRREVVDTLRRHQLQVHRQEQKRKEQRYLDELFLLRREFLRPS
ncbi:MAG: flagellar export protein FliJ [Acidobacteriia bacterium]|nr:flagellar export protein FliJ [Terriglobia bacterium]